MRRFYSLVIFAVFFVLALGSTDDKGQSSFGSSDDIPGTSEGDIDWAVDTLWLIDGGSGQKRRYRRLLSTIKTLYPTHSYEKLADIAAKAKELCSRQDRPTSTMSALLFIQSFSDGLTPQLRSANPPSEQLVMFIASGCPK